MANINLKDFIKDESLRDILSSYKPSQMIDMANDLIQYANSQVAIEKIEKIALAANAIYDYYLTFDEPLQIAIMLPDGSYSFERIDKAQVEKLDGKLALALYKC